MVIQGRPGPAPVSSAIDRALDYRALDRKTEDEGDREEASCCPKRQKRECCPIFHLRTSEALLVTRHMRELRIQGSAARPKEQI